MVIALKNDHRKVTSLDLLLDLSVPFDTIDHDIFVCHFQTDMGITGTAL